MGVPIERLRFVAVVVGPDLRWDEHRPVHRAEPPGPSGGDLAGQFGGQLLTVTLLMVVDVACRMRIRRTTSATRS